MTDEKRDNTNRGAAWVRRGASGKIDIAGRIFRAGMLAVESDNAKAPAATLYIDDAKGNPATVVGLWKPEGDAKYIFSGNYSDETGDYKIFVFRAEQKNDKSPAVQFSVVAKETPSGGATSNGKGGNSVPF